MPIFHSHQFVVAALRAPLVGLLSILLVVASQVSGLPARADSSATPVVNWTATEYAFNAPETLPAGQVTIRMANDGQEEHHGQLFRLNDGVTFNDFTAALRQDPGAALQFVSAEGGPGAISPQFSTTVTLDLQPGHYALVCLIPDPDGVPHVARGMLKELQVIAGSEVTEDQPVLEGTFSLRDFSFDLPDMLPAGPVTYRVFNAGPQVHELGVVKLVAGTTAQDVQQWYASPAGPPPFVAVGGINALDAGKSGYLQLDLMPGSYASICLVPDPTSGVSHLHLGMIKTFVVV